MRNYLTSELSSHLAVSLSEINLDKILATGQVFRWRKHQETWFGVIRRKLWVLRQDDTGIYYTSHDLQPTGHVTTQTTTPTAELRDYFNLDHKLSELHEAWSSDKHLAQLLVAHSGLRLIRQDPYECLLAFITSSCNNIPRISSLMSKLSELSAHSVALSGTTFHALPDIALFSEPGTEHRLREMGFGYRAKYLVAAMNAVCERGGVPWLEGLREVKLDEARQELAALAGVGPKVAACVCLMSLDKHQAVPIDTHIHQVAIKWYNRPNKSLTPALHKSLELFFQSKHGSFAGWAQAYLFYSNSNKEKKDTIPKVKKAPKAVERRTEIDEKVIDNRRLRSSKRLKR